MVKDVVKYSIKISNKKGRNNDKSQFSKESIVPNHLVLECRHVRVSLGSRSVRGDHCTKEVTFTRYRERQKLTVLV